MHLQDENTRPSSVEGAGMTHLVQDFRGLRLDEPFGYHSENACPPGPARQTPRGPQFDHPPPYGLMPTPGGYYAMRHGRHGPHPHPARHPRGPRTSSRSCNWQATDHRREHEREREYAQARALSQQRRRRPSAPIGYPWNVAVVEAELETSPNDMAVITRLWKQIMEYWFPSRAGFTVTENWSLPDPENRWMFTPLQADLAVMWLGSESPIAIVLIHPPGSPADSEGLMEAGLRTSATKVFERVAMWSSHPRILMVSAAGSRWNAFIGSTDSKAREGLIGDGSDWFGPRWENKVTSEDSFKVMSFGVDAMKTYVSVSS